ncbi:hypothetical protein [Myroides injenensis]|uniref:hypothetical protein n=1 Tax=Myroides injenensis TaxID=1183151 RepID=UPI00226D63F3|nr:hypothetical protein [Myroides injenensis]
MKLTPFVCFIAFFTGMISHAQVLEIYSNDGKESYIGCLTCPASDNKSIWNHHGTYGNLYSKNSIWNKYGIYGDKESNFSPWNIDAEKPPIIKKDGKVYGYFTLNKFIGERVEINLTKMLYDYYMDIREDVSKWADSPEKLKPKKEEIVEKK